MTIPGSSIGARELPNFSGVFFDHNAKSFRAENGVQLTSGAVFTVPVIMGIATQSIDDGAVIYAAGRSSVGDGGGGTFIYYKYASAPVDNGIIFAPLNGIGRFYREGHTFMGFTGPVNAMWWGLPLDGVSDCLPVFNAIKTYAAQYLSTVRIPRGTYCFSDTFVDDEDGIHWEFAGTSPAFADTLSVAEHLLRCASVIQPHASNTSEFTIWRSTSKTAIGSVQKLGGSLKNVCIYGKNTANCLEVQSVCSQRFTDILLLDAKNFGVKIGWQVAVDSSAIGSTIRNIFDNVDALFCKDGFVLCGDASVVSNASLNAFYNCNPRGGTTPWQLENCDSNFFYACGGTAILHAGDTGSYSGGVDRSARANVFMGFQGGLTAKQAITPPNPDSYRNIMLGFTKENGAALTLENNAKLIVMTDQISPGADTSGQFFGRETYGTVATKGGNQGINTGVWVPVTFGTELYDTCDGHVTSGATERLTVPQGVRVAQFTASITFDPAKVTGYRSLRLMKNGNTFVGMPIVTVSAAVTNIVQLTSSDLEVIPGDYFTIEASHNEGSSVNTLSADTTWFAMACK